MFVTPFAYIFSFQIGPEWFNSLLKGETPALVNYTKGDSFGVSGIWMGFIVGLSHQIIAYLALLKKVDWSKASQLARARQMEENNQEFDIMAPMINTHHGSSFCSSASDMSHLALSVQKWGTSSGRPRGYSAASFSSMHS